MAKAKAKSAAVVEEVGEPQEQAEQGEQQEQAEQSAPAYSVHSKIPEGFWRLGQKFTQEPKVFEPGELSEAQLGVLKAEKMLVVRAVL